MNKTDIEKITIDEVETITAEEKKADVTTELTSEQISAKLKELEGFNARLLQENKELKGSKEPVTPEPVKDIAKPTTTNNPDLSLRDISEISKLAAMHSIEDLEFGKQFIGTSFGKTLSEVMGSAGIKAHLELKKEKANSTDVMDIQDISIAPIETKNSIIRDIKEGRIDINAKENVKYRKLWVEHMAFGK